MLGEKKIKTTLFGEEVILDFGMRFSGRLRQLYPNFEEIANAGDPIKVMIMSVHSALPPHLQNKTEDELIDELDNIDDPMILHRSAKGLESAMGFLAVALTGAVNAVEAVERGAKPKK